MADGRSQTDLTMPDLFTFWFTSRKAVTTILGNFQFMIK
jgi:hypothetical protein